MSKKPAREPYSGRKPYTNGSPADNLDLRRWCVEQACRFPFCEPPANIEIVDRAQWLFNWVTEAK